MFCSLRKLYTIHYSTYEVYEVICLLEAVKAVTICCPGQPGIILGFSLK